MKISPALHYRHNSQSCINCHLDFRPVVRFLHADIPVLKLNCVHRAARLSMMTTIIRIVDLRAGIRRTSYAIAVFFGLMWMAVLAQKLYVCCTNSCNMTHDVAVSQLTSTSIVFNS